MTGPRPTRASLPGLGDHLRRIAGTRDRAGRAAAFADLANEAERAGAVESLLLRLLARGANGQRFALEVAALLALPLPEGVIFPLVDLVEQSRFPTKLRINVAAKVLQSVAADSPIAARIVEIFRRKVSPGRAVNRLRRLAALVPHVPALRDALDELEAGVAAPCPRCGARLGFDDLIRHLWEKHRLLFENGRVREPWDVIGQWITEYARTNRPEFLDRSCDLAQALDPNDGLSRVHRLLLLGGTDDEEAHALLRAEAADQNATLCPHCYALVAQPTRAKPADVLVGSGRVDGGGFRVELSDAYLYSRMIVDTPSGRIQTGPEPGHALTKRGAILLFLLPLLLVSCVFAVLPRLMGMAPVVPVGVMLLVSGIVYLVIAMTWEDHSDPSGRAVDHAWNLLVPRILQRELRKSDAAFLAGLADASRGRGDIEEREDSLRQASAIMRKERIAIPYLTPLSVLQITDATQQEADDLLPIADEVSEVFQALLPFEHGEHLVRELRGDSVDRTRRARLRVLVLAQAFAAGLEAEDLRMIGQLCPTLGMSYASEDRDGLSRLRLLWLYRPRRLWQRVGSATTVFDLARYPRLAENYLKLRPDLLLFQASGGSGEVAPILVCEEGVVYRDVVITDPGTRIRTKAKSIVRGGGYELTIDDRVFKFREDPTILAHRLRGWTHFLFEEFLPRARMLTRRRSAHGDRLISQKAMTCTECRRTFLGLTGEIGFTELPPAIEGVESV
jgi:hypothetical protein